MEQSKQTSRTGLRRAGRALLRVLAGLLVLAILAGAVVTGLLLRAGHEMYRQAMAADPPETAIARVREREDFLPLDQVPTAFRQMLLTSEDHRFYTHGGVDPLAILRAAAENLRQGRLAQGGSTITQQLAKNLWFSFEKRFERKVAEVFGAWRLERMLTKDEILELYINVVWFGEGCTGLRAAARHYYDCEPMALSPSQCQALVDTLKSPATHNPNALAQAE